jgi:hypothetical protein
MIWAGCVACGTPTEITRRRINAPVVRICFRWQCEFGANDLGAFTGGELHILHATGDQTGEKDESRGRGAMGDDGRGE